MKSAEQVVLFSDLDGSLLDADTYSFEAARPALDELRRRSIPLVPCTSKTAAETRHFLKRLEFEAPFIVESGAGVYLPERCFPGLAPLGEARGDCRLVRLAVGYDEVLKGMADLREHTGGAIRGFHDMTSEEIARATGLPPELAALAKGREFDEPFRLLREEQAWPADLAAIAGRRGLRVSRGGRFWHLHGDTDKGRAVELVKSLYAKQGGRLHTIGAGDSAMDLPLLAAVDDPLIIAKPGGGYDPILMERLKSPLAAGEGSAGWNRAVLESLAKHFG